MPGLGAPPPALFLTQVLPVAFVPFSSSFSPFWNVDHLSSVASVCGTAGSANDPERSGGGGTSSHAMRTPAVSRPATPPATSSTSERMSTSLRMGLALLGLSGLSSKGPPPPLVAVRAVGRGVVVVAVRVVPVTAVRQLVEHRSQDLRLRARQRFRRALQGGRAGAAGVDHPNGAIHFGCQD